MTQSMELRAARYSSEDRARTIVDMLEQMHRAANIDLQDAVLVTRSSDGKLHIQETREVTTGKGARRGAITAGLFGLIFPPSLLASAIIGAGAGAAWGKLRDTGIQTS